MAQSERSAHTSATFTPFRPELERLVQYLSEVRIERESPGQSQLPRYLAASDLHGNAPRLRELLNTARRESIAHIYLVGDLYSGSGGWGVFRMLEAETSADPGWVERMTLMWGNHELAFVSGMLGNDKQLRFFYACGGKEIVAELNAEREHRGEPPLTLSGSLKLTAEDRAALRAQPELQEMCRWIQATHRLFATDVYGTGYLHAFPKISRHGQFVFQYRGQPGIAALPLIEEDLREAVSSDNPVFSMLLQTETSPLWSIFEISNARQFDQAARAVGVRQIIFGHRHHTEAVNVSKLNRQIGIAVDFDQGLGGYLLIGPHGLTFRRFIHREDQQFVEREIVESAGRLTARDAHLHDIEEFLFRRLVKLEQGVFASLPLQSAQARQEFAYLESLRERGFPWIHRLYAEVNSSVKDLDLRTEMFKATVASGDEEAFRSFIHLLFQKTLELESLGKDWYNPRYLEAKSIARVLMEALRDMPVARLGLLDINVRGTTSRFNLTELYKRVLELEDPELALLAVHNLGMLGIPQAVQELRRAFFHDVRKVRVKAAEVLAELGEVVYPLVAPLLRNSDGWVRCLAMWTIANLGLRGESAHSNAERRDMAVNPQATSPLRHQAIIDLHRVLAQENDWFLHMFGKELLRKLGDSRVEAIPDQAEIPNLTEAVVATLQDIVDSEKEPYRRSFKIYFISVELSSLVYRRGLIGLDIDDLRIYVNNPDYFPPYYRHYKSGDLDIEGIWRGWRRLWLRGETANLPDGPRIIQLAPHDANECPRGPRTIVLYDHRSSDKVALPAFDEIVSQYGIGKVKDRFRHTLLEQWDTALTRDEQVMLCRLHAAALPRMLLDLPSEIVVTPQQWKTLEGLARKTLVRQGQETKSIIKLQDCEPGTRRRFALPCMIAYPRWLDVPKNFVVVYRSGKAGGER